jgi:hypothetical protein
VVPVPHIIAGKQVTLTLTDLLSPKFYIEEWIVIFGVYGLRPNGSWDLLRPQISVVDK